jgi:hypothetical protein
MVTLAMIRQAFMEESMTQTWVGEWKSPNSLSETGEEQSHEHADNFLSHQGD